MTCCLGSPGQLPAPLAGLLRGLFASLRPRAPAATWWTAPAAQLGHAPACRPAARVPGRGGWPPPRPHRQRAAGLAWPRLGERLSDAASSTRRHSVPKQEQTRTEKATSTRLKTSNQKIVTQITKNGNETRAMDSQLLNLTDSN